MQIAELTSGNEAAQRRDLGTEAVGQTDHEARARLPGSLYDTGRAGRRQGDGAFHEDVLSGFERPDRHVFVQAVGRGYDHRIEVFSRECLIWLDHLGYAEAACDRLRLGAIGVGERHQLDVFALAKNRDVYDLADRTRPYDRHPDRGGLSSH